MFKRVVICPFSVILYEHGSSLSAIMHTADIPASLWGIGCCVTSSSSLLFLLLSHYNSSHLPPICCFHVSKMFLPLTNFKYSLLVLSTITYKHLKIIESQRTDEKRQQWSCTVEVIKYGLEPTVFGDGICIAMDLGEDTPMEYIINALFSFSRQLKVVSPKC